MADRRSPRCGSRGLAIRAPAREHLAMEPNSAPPPLAADLLPIAELAAFVTAAELGNMRKAAERLQLSNAAISQRIKNAERLLGLTLLHRSTRGVTPTAAGLALLPPAREALAACSRLRRLARTLAGDGDTGTLAIACPGDFGTRYLAPAVAAFLQEHPQAAIRLDCDNRTHDLLRSRYDLTLRGYACFAGEPLPECNVRMRAIARRSQGLYASPDYLARHGTPGTPAELARHDGIAFQPDHGTDEPRWRLRRGAERCDPAPAARIVTDSRDSASRLLLAGHGIGLMFDALAAPLVASGRLRPVLPDWRPPPVTLYLIAAAARSALCDRFIAHLERMLADCPELAEARPAAG